LKRQFFFISFRTLLIKRVKQPTNFIVLLLKQLKHR